MKVVVIIPYFYPKVGGLENYALEITKGLSNCGWKVTVITSNHLAHRETREKVGNIQVIRLNTQFYLSNTPVSIKWFNRISQLLDEIKPDIVNAHTPVPFISDIGVIAAKRKNIPVVLTYQNDIFKESLLFKLIGFFYYLSLGTKSLELSDSIVVTSDHYAKLSQNLKPFLNKVVVIPPGIHKEALIKKTDKNPYVLFVGQLDSTHRHKGLEYLIQAVSDLKKQIPKLRLFVVGKGNDMDRYKKIVRDLKATKNIFFKGFVPDEQMSGYYANALCLCLPSISQSEGFGMVILEAATQKTPSVGSRVGGIPSVIIDNQTGLLVTPRDSKLLAQRIKSLYDHPQQVKKLGENAFARVSREFMWKQQISKTHKLFLSKL